MLIAGYFKVDQRLKNNEQKMYFSRKYTLRQTLNIGNLIFE
jgi:hypothetical protein